jgi:hypothetical protein
LVLEQKQVKLSPEAMENIKLASNDADKLEQELENSQIYRGSISECKVDQLMI